MNNVWSVIPTTMTTTESTMAIMVFLSIVSPWEDHMYPGSWNRKTLLMRKRNYLRLVLSRSFMNPDSSKEKSETFPGYTIKARSWPLPSTGSDELIRLS